MTHYSETPGNVRVDFFKPESGKWYMTEELDMSDFYDQGATPHDAVRAALAETRHGPDADKRWIIVVMAPYHKSAYPVMLTPGKASYEPWPQYVALGAEPENPPHSVRDWMQVFDLVSVGEATESDRDVMMSQDEFMKWLSDRTDQVWVGRGSPAAFKAVVRWRESQ